MISRSMRLYAVSVMFMNEAFTGQPTPPPSPGYLFSSAIFRGHRQARPKSHIHQFVPKFSVLLSHKLQNDLNSKNEAKIGGKLG